MAELLFKCFLLSLLLHVIDDFVLQPICLSKLKQKKFWMEQQDYKINLIQDQLIHIGQIILTYIIIWICYKQLEIYTVI